MFKNIFAVGVIARFIHDEGYYIHDIFLRFWLLFLNHIDYVGKVINVYVIVCMRQNDSSRVRG